MTKVKPDFSKELMSLTNVAEYLHVDLTTLRRWIRQDRFPLGSKLTNHRYVFRKTHIDEWLENKRTKPAEENG